MLLQNLDKLNERRFTDTSWDFRNEYTKFSTHGYHTYPAMMIPQIARRLIEVYGKGAKTILDPFMGSGTALLEGVLHSQFKKAYGIDINPLARLISKVKTTAIEPALLWNEYDKLIKNCLSEKYNASFKNKKIEPPDFFNINFWFKPEAIIDLSIIKQKIDKIENKDIKDFFLVAFSETVRSASNTRKGEFKLYRMTSKMLKKRNPKALEDFRAKAKENIFRMENFIKEKNGCEVRILDEDTRFKTSVPDNSIDIIVTSPPYGDSRTTVAYGQFSRLALQWLGYDEKIIRNIDKVSLGGIPTKNLENNLCSFTLKKILCEISKIDSKRAKDVLSFYIDFDKCVEELHRITKKGSFLCFVLGNRTVKGIKIPTDIIITELFQSKNHYEHINTFIRNIPHKRMPKLNSPTNIKGKLSATMNEEYIVILQKR